MQQICVLITLRYGSLTFFLHCRLQLEEPPCSDICCRGRGFPGALHGVSLGLWKICLKMNIEQPCDRASSGWLLRDLAEALSWVIYTMPCALISARIKHQQGNRLVVKSHSEITLQCLLSYLLQHNLWSRKSSKIYQLCSISQKWHILVHKMYSKGKPIQ